MTGTPMGDSANQALATATVELRTLVTVRVPLPGGVTADDVDEVASAVDAVSALPAALKARLEAAAITVDGTEPALAEIHYIWVD